MKNTKAASPKKKRTWEMFEIDFLDNKTFKRNSIAHSRFTVAALWATIPDTPCISVRRRVPCKTHGVLLVHTFLRWETLYLVHAIAADGCVKVNGKRGAKESGKGSSLRWRDDHTNLRVQMQKIYGIGKVGVSVSNALPSLIYSVKCSDFLREIKNASWIIIQTIDPEAK